MENKTHEETFPKFPSVLRVIDRSDRNQPIAVSITRKTDGNFGNVSACVLFSRINENGGKRN